MAKDKYDKDALFTKILGSNTDKQSSENEAVKKEKLSRQAGEQELSITASNCKIGRPGKTQEAVKKYSYYLTERHVLSIKKLAANMDTDFSSIVRIAIEEFARKGGKW